MISPKRFKFKRITFVLIVLCALVTLSCVSESPGQTVTTDGIWLKDNLGRTLILHGVNLGGSTKVPAHPNGATHIREGFFDYEDVSFVGRPFPLGQED